MATLTLRTVNLLASTDIMVRPDSLRSAPVLMVHVLGWLAIMVALPLVGKYRGVDASHVPRHTRSNACNLLLRRVHLLDTPAPSFALRIRPSMDVRVGGGKIIEVGRNLTIRPGAGEVGVGAFVGWYLTPVSEFDTQSSPPNPTLLPRPGRRPFSQPLTPSCCAV